MPRQKERRAGADLEVIGRQLHALGANVLDLLHNTLGINGNAVADDADDSLAEDSRRQQVQRKFTILVDDGVTRVAAALITDDNVIIGADQIDHTPLAFIAPVDSDDRTI